jgi:hypothetical protein
MYSVSNQIQDLLEEDELEHVLILFHHYRLFPLDLAFDVEKQCDKFLQKRKIKLKKIDRNTKRKRIIPVRIVWNACSTFVESNADVSINETPFFSINHKEKYIKIKKKKRIYLISLPENALASSLGTERKCLKSDLFPTSEITIFESA